ncbi:MAG: hypothetical protein WC797_03930 [Candidatus Paceibacterota bacterium]|jgi:hypothetical protein
MSINNRIISAIKKIKEAECSDDIENILGECEAIAQIVGSGVADGSITEENKTFKLYSGMRKALEESPFVEFEE